MLLPPFPQDWETFITPYCTDSVQVVLRQCAQRLGSGPWFPCPEDVFRAFVLTPPARVRVVLVGQDPYHGAGQAHGLAFSVPRGCPHPPSLRNILKEAASDLGCALEELSGAAGDLTAWAEQGVLLLNDVLTVPPGVPGAHAGFGWEQLTGAVLRALAAEPSARVFVFWGRQAAAKAGYVYRPEHTVLTAPHPSPLSAYRGFFGSRPFSAANAWLEGRGVQPVRW